MDHAHLAGACLQIRQLLFGVAELVGGEAHSIHDRQVETAKLSVVVACLQVIQSATGLQRSTESPCCHKRHLCGIVSAARPHIIHKDQARIVEHGAVAFRHGVQSTGQVRKLAAVVLRNPLPIVRSFVVRGRMVSVADVEERIEQPGNVAAKQKSGDPRFVRLKSESDDVTHQSHVIADVFRQSVVRPGHFHDGLAAILCSIKCLVLIRSQSLDPFLDFANAGEILVEF
jgi:hypothetical protein